MRAIEFECTQVPEDANRIWGSMTAGTVARMSAPFQGAPLVQSRECFAGIVAPDTTIERLYFEVVADIGLEEGRLVEVPIGTRVVTYQLVDGLTREEIVQQKNTRGFARAQAQKIGEWNVAEKRFQTAKWLPMPNAPVILKRTESFHTTREAIGHFPGTDYPVFIRDIHELVTHNTAILGILGIGKSMLAMELCERMIAEGIKIICIDLTDQYQHGLEPFIDDTSTATIANLKTIGAQGKTRVQQNVEDGGSKKAFAAGMKAVLGSVPNPSRSATRATPESQRV